MNDSRENFLKELEAKSNSIPSLINLVGWEAFQLNRQTDNIHWMYNSGFPINSDGWEFLVNDIVERISRLNRAVDSLRKIQK
jgi:hypothetical protein